MSHSHHVPHKVPCDMSHHFNFLISLWLRKWVLDFYSIDLAFFPDLKETFDSDKSEWLKNRLWFPLYFILQCNWHFEEWSQSFYNIFPNLVLTARCCLICGSATTSWPEFYVETLIFVMVVHLSETYWFLPSLVMFILINWFPVNWLFVSRLIKSWRWRNTMQVCSCHQYFLLHQHWLINISQWNFTIFSEN